MKIIYSMLFMLAAFCVSSQNRQVITLHSLLTEIVDVESVARWPLPEFTMNQASSYDRRSVSPELPGWFANDDQNQFIRSEKKSGYTEYVMMDSKGPGAIVRFWLTMQSNQGRLRIYFDNEENASIQIDAYDLMKVGFNVGKALLSYHQSEIERGNTMYLPLPYQKHCKITFEPDTLVERTPHYYQINYRTYPKGTAVKTFNMNDLPAEKSIIDSVEKELWNPTLKNNYKELKLQKSIASNKTETVDLPEGSAAIQLLSLRLSASTKEELIRAWSLVILKMEFDDHQTVWCPVGDFAGSGFGGQPIKSWYRELDKEGKVVSRWVMPYKRNAKITIINKAEFNVDVDMSVIVGDRKWDNNTMYFHADYKFEADVKDAIWNYDAKAIAKNDPLAPTEWNFVEIKGRGIYLGNTLSLYNNMDQWYGEGDAKIWVDDDTFPSEFGTGLEDYYNISWGIFIYQTPFANAPRADNNNSQGYNTFTRTRNLDGIPFRKSFKYDLEMLSWKGGTIDCSATTYWYGLPGASCNISQQKKESALPFPTLNKK
jgi:hypothetical protein